MFKKIQFSEKRVYPTLVVATMSSGKSTVINALIGADLLSSRNSACTTKALAIMDDDKADGFKMYVVDKEGNARTVSEADKEIIAKYNNTDEIEEMLIAGQIQGIRNSKKAMLLIDTPGINNSLDDAHEVETKEVLATYTEGLILYIINAEQMGTDDDSKFLTFVSEKIREHDKFQILFAVNKMDSIDPEKEDFWQMIKNCRSYIESRGIKDPRIIPVSAESALLFKKALNGMPMTKAEQRRFEEYYCYFENSGISLADYVLFPERGDPQETICVNRKQYSRAQIYKALYHTGIVTLEQAIDDMLVDSLKMGAPRITIARKKASSAPESGQASKNAKEERYHEFTDLLQSLHRHNRYFKGRRTP